MYRDRVIPCLLLKNDGLVKTVKFKDPRYIGDPINAIKIFNEKEVDEIIIIDIEASKQNKEPNFTTIKEIAGECFMPVCYGGGIKNFEHAQKIFNLGIEKISINSLLFNDPTVAEKIAKTYGSQSLVASIDCKKTMLNGYQIVAPPGSKNIKKMTSWLTDLENMGVGEIFLNSVDRDGTMQGYDLELIKIVSHAVSIPVIACGGASSIEDLLLPITKAGASAVAAGSLFVFHGRHRAVLINYPTQYS
jgi:cyclase